MRGERTWAVAVRTTDGDIDIVVHDAPDWAERWSKVPLVRGVASLGESLSLGFKSLAWAANRQVPEEEQISSRAMGWTIGIAVAFFAAIFLVGPALLAKGAGDWLGISGFEYHLAEGAIRMAVFLGYLLLIGQLKDIKRVFQYHGAEHKAIAAFENGAELTPEAAQRFSTEHVRCGTNFLLTVMVVTIFVYAFVGRPALALLVVSRIVLIPLVAGASYEVIRYAARHMDRRWVRVAMRPGLTLQLLTTRQPTDDQVEVAIASLRAVLTAQQQAEVDARSAVVAVPGALTTA